MKQILYLECNSGISGDMTVAALLDLGANEAKLRQTLASLPLEGYHVEIRRVRKSGLDACDFDVVLDAAHENHDHDMEYLHGHSNHEHAEHGYDSEYVQTENLHHEHRGLQEVLSILARSTMTARAKELACRIFTILGEAEAKVHGATLDTVHFHEVGAVDSIVDIAATAICLDDLGIEEVIVPYLCEGRGTIRCAHGILPVPVPATTAIVNDYALPLQILSMDGELVTPTGAAIVAAICTAKELPGTMTIRKVGLGAGKRTYERPSLLRAMLIEAKEQKNSDTIVRLEANVDDCSGESLGYVMNLLMEAGARDVHFVPTYMKKNRPGYELVVLCDEDNRTNLENLIFTNTTTIGIRRSTMERTVLPREIQTVETAYGSVRVKVISLPNGQKRITPEYDDVCKICKESGMNFQEAYTWIQSLK